MSVTYTGADKNSTLHVVTIGINTYRNPALNLNYGVPDADGVRDFFAAQPRKIFKDIKTHSLRDRDATKAGIIKLLDSLKKTRPEDVVIVYLAGHGDTVDKEWYFMPTDIAYPERKDHVRKNGIPASKLDALVNEAPAQKIIMLMDSCKSGAALARTRGFEERKALSRLARASGIHVIAAAAKEQFAIELKEYGHGAFTFVLLEGLTGSAGKTLNGDDLVTIRELIAHIEDRLPDLSEAGSGAPQFPVINSRGNDFPLAVRV